MRILQKYDQVVVPDPSSTKGDLHNHSFVGQVVGAYHELDESLMLVVADGDDDHFDIEADRVTLCIEVDPTGAGFMKQPWDFVATYYPNYYKSDEIAANSDLLNIVETDWKTFDDFTEDVNENGENCGHEMYNTIRMELAEEQGIYSADVAHEEVMELAKARYYRSNNDIYEATLKAYILSLGGEPNG